MNKIFHQFEEWRARRCYCDFESNRYSWNSLKSIFHISRWRRGEKAWRENKSIRRVVSPVERTWKVFTFEPVDADAGNCFQVIKLAELLPLKVFPDPRRISKSFTCGGRSFREDRGQDQLRQSFHPPASHQTRLPSNYSRSMEERKEKSVIRFSRLNFYSLISRRPVRKRIFKNSCLFQAYIDCYFD